MMTAAEILAFYKAWALRQELDLSAAHLAKAAEIIGNDPEFFADQTCRRIHDTVEKQLP